MTHKPKAFLISVGTIVVFVILGLAITAFGISSASLHTNADAVVGFSAVSIFLSAWLAAMAITMYTYIRAYWRMSTERKVSRGATWLYGGAFFWFIFLVLGAALGTLIIDTRASSTSQRRDGIITLSVIYAIASLVGTTGVFWGWWLIKESRNLNKGGSARRAMIQDDTDDM